MATVHSSPVRRLFGEQRSESCKRLDSFQRKSEMERVCRKSVERLRDLFNFDLDCMEQISVQSNKENSRGTHSITVCSTPTTPCPERDDSHEHWLWQEIDLKSTYVPEFYHPKRYYSDSHLIAPKTQSRGRIPQTPQKQGELLQKSLVEKHRSLCKATEKKNQQPHSGMPTLFQVWGPRIRRSSHSDPEQSEIKLTRGRAVRARNGSSGHNPDSQNATLSLNPEVPANSPIKQTTLSRLEILETDVLETSTGGSKNARRSRSVTSTTKQWDQDRPRVSTSVPKKYHQITLSGKSCNNRMVFFIQSTYLLRINMLTFCFSVADLRWVAAFDQFLNRTNNKHVLHFSDSISLMNMARICCNALCKSEPRYRADPRSVAKIIEYWAGLTHMHIYIYI